MKWTIFDGGGKERRERDRAERGINSMSALTTIVPQQVKLHWETHTPFLASNVLIQGGGE